MRRPGRAILPPGLGSPPLRLAEPLVVWFSVHNDVIYGRFDVKELTLTFDANMKLTFRT